MISDLHLGAGAEVEGRRNLLEDFHSDKELVEFFEYYSIKDYATSCVELVINGDFLDLLAIPYVDYFDDEFWSESASLDKLNIIIDAHQEVFVALNAFLKTKNKTLVYLIGNHDAELVFEKLQKRFFELFDEDVHEKITLRSDLETYEVAKGVFIQHGHQYESAHHFDHKHSITKSQKGESYFIPPWGSYYVTHVINKFKQERYHSNAVRPIKNFLIHGLIFDTFFTLRFMVANLYYFIMVRFLHFYRLKLGLKEVFSQSAGQLELFKDYEEETREFFSLNPDAKVLIVGHTHEPQMTEFSDGTTFINTGTWTRMINLELGKQTVKTQLTFAQIELNNIEYELDAFTENVSIELNRWDPKTDLPYEEYL